MILAIWEGTWADEMSLTAAKAYRSEEEYEADRSRFISRFSRIAAKCGEVQFYYGSNQFNYYTFPREVTDYLDIQAVPPEAEAVTRAILKCLRADRHWPLDEEWMLLDDDEFETWLEDYTQRDW